MSDSYKCKLRGKMNREGNQWIKNWRKLEKKLTREGIPFSSHVVRNLTNPYKKLTADEDLTIINYSKAPSWFRNLLRTRPRRAEDRNKIKTITFDNADEVIFNEESSAAWDYW